jgi:zinc/manganese transport system substrate-binding protein
MPTLPRLAAATLLTLALGGTLSACDSTSASPVATTGQRRFQLVAAENFWGSIAAQLAGDRASLRSIIVNPETDPHSYQPSAQDARTVAAANMVIVNGIGYDNWMTQLLAADQAGAHTVLNVGDVLGLGEGQNPHQWYSPASVNTVVRQIVADYDRIDPSDSAYFAERERTFETNDLARYDALREEIRSRYAGVPVGYSESIFQPLGEALGLRLLTPYSFAKSIAEGTDVTAQGLDLQQPERHPGRPARHRSRQGAAHPGRERHRDPLAGHRLLRAMAGQRARRAESRTAPGHRQVTRRACSVVDVERKGCDHDAVGARLQRRLQQASALVVQDLVAALARDDLRDQDRDTRAVRLDRLDISEHRSDEAPVRVDQHLDRDT